MGSIVAQTIVDKGEIIIQDATNVRWPQAELLGWLNDGQREVVLLRPDAYTKSVSHNLTAGETQQSIPSDGIRVISVVRNNGATKTAIRQIDKRILDDQIPDWHYNNKNAIAQWFSYDDRDPTRFYVYPCQPDANPGSVLLTYSCSPPDVVIGAAIAIPDVFANSLIDYMLYRAYWKDADYAVNEKRVMDAYQAFTRSLTGNIASNAAFSATGKENRG